MGTRSTTKAAAGPGAETPSAGSLASLTVLGVLSALWALFLWAELVLSRTGGTPFCALGPAADCGRVWDSAFAVTVSRWTGLPVAGWGLVWGLVAFVLPLGGLLRLAEARPLPAALVSAVRVNAAAGVVTVFVMLAVSAAEKAFCVGCFATYLLVAGYAGIALLGWQRAGLPDALKGLALTAAATVCFFLLLLYPGLETPRLAGQAGREAIVSAPPGAVSAPGTGDPDRDRQLVDFVASLAPQLQQVLSDSLSIYRSAPAQAPPPPRKLLGPETAPVRITEWTDVLCDHCADLHATLLALRANLPPGSFSIDSRQFPLDGACNPLLQPRSEESVRCLAARAQVCLESHERAFEFAGALFENQKALTSERVFELARPFANRAELEQCLAGPATQSKLEEDIRSAAAYDPDGTPIVAVNGRRGTSFGPFLYAMVLTRGAATHPAFASLPPPNPRAHLH